MEESNLLPKQAKAEHLCVLIHGLWGNPTHLDYIVSSLREKYEESSLQILCPKSNAGTLTYDGIELGGERVAHEVEEAIRSSAEQGCKIRKLSVVGYSLGGLIARYAIGLLYAKGYFDDIEPVNFTTFASPHVGVRSPARKSHFWNVLGARCVSTSGRQLFMIDSFRDTGKPLLSILATPGSIFMLALAKFRHRTLYANAVNDLSAVYYTTAISRTDPFTQVDDLSISYVDGYAPVVINPDRPILLRPKSQSLIGWLASTARSTISVLPFRLFLFTVVGFASVIFVVNAAYQTILSEKRIRLHEQGRSGVFYNTYRVPLIMEGFRNAVEDMYETANAAQKPEYISNPVPEEGPHGASSEYPNSTQPERAEAASTSKEPHQCADNTTTHEEGDAPFPTLALTTAQFRIIDNLDSVGFRKYPVYIHQVRHSHAAIIVRMPRESFKEGKIVVRHWIEEEFRI
ncbi:lipase/serine esterase [Arthroderma uncinatum]|uniref:lipase/serine esterase n=1 Tax=Arthroderma uncinatum TaxID=74035 RepID=UPI00144A7423|nr:lipase/serine esterase [Arthroderma uncinatum]KAF3490750.1 lipase/serine esterase [Arthroderma uncinatum]